MGNDYFIKPQYKPPKVTVVQFLIESGFVGSPGVVKFFHGSDVDNTTSYTQTSYSGGSDFWGGGSTNNNTGTSSYSDFNIGW